MVPIASMIQLVNLIIRVKTRKYFAFNPGIYECFDIGRKEIRLYSGTANYLKRLDGKRISAWFQANWLAPVPHPAATSRSMYVRTTQTAQ
jgi:hypothetical protein